MPKQRAFQCSSDSSSCGYGVPDNCGLGQCQGPFQDNVQVYSVSSVGCDSSSCPVESSGAFSDLCESDTMSKCPRIKHQVKVEKDCSSSSSSSGRCGVCHYRRCKCNKGGGCNYKAILCADESCSDSDSDCSDGAYIAPIPGCNIAVGCDFSDCSSSSDSDSCDPCPKKKREKIVVEVCGGCQYPPSACKCVGIRAGSQTRVITVTFVAKSGHPWANRICLQQGAKCVTKPHCIAIDGVKGKSIHLTRGHKYQLVIAEFSVKYTFCFTTDPFGGPKHHACVGGQVSGVVKGCAIVDGYFTVGKECPKQFYYQCKEVPCMGGIVYVHDR